MIDPHVMQGKMDSADFEADTITLKMTPPYFASAGMYALIPLENYLELKRNQKEPPDFMREMRRGTED